MNSSNDVAVTIQHIRTVTMENLYADVHMHSLFKITLLDNPAKKIYSKSQSIITEGSQYFLDILYEQEKIQDVYKTHGVATMCGKKITMLYVEPGFKVHLKINPSVFEFTILECTKQEDLLWLNLLITKTREANQQLAERKGDKPRHSCAIL